MISLGGRLRKQSYGRAEFERAVSYPIRARDFDIVFVLPVAIYLKTLVYRIGPKLAETVLQLRFYVPLDVSQNVRPLLRGTVLYSRTWVGGVDRIRAFFVKPVVVYDSTVSVFIFHNCATRDTVEIFTMKEASNDLRGPTWTP